jgi:transcriptional regulator with XRE-family HTH domain
MQDIAWARQLGRNGGARIIRETAGFTGAEIARAGGWSPSTVSRWERGERVPRGDAAERWARLLRKLVEGRAERPYSDEGALDPPRSVE